MRMVFISLFEFSLFPYFSHVINSVAFSSNGENLLVCSGEAQVRVMDRSGQQWAETVKGTLYHSFI